MDFIEVNISIDPDTETNREILISALDELGFDSWWEEADIFRAYISDENYKAENLQKLQAELAPEIRFSFKADTLPDKNWNEVWESNFEPVIINEHCAVRAPFHPPMDNYKYELIIEPQMSFGTAHHETTAMILNMMTDMNMQGSQVLDMGSGTGVLAVMARLKGASKVDAVDNDQWAFNNTRENIARNSQQVEVLLGDVDIVEDRKYDFILANINRNILLRHIPYYAKMLTNGGKIIFSGFYTEDLESIREKAETYKLHLINYDSRRNWVAALFTA
jgi:ribosomal protein L11 methyltransferase